MPVTQRDIAREAGVSQAVVSDVLHNRPQGRVSTATRERILTAARRLNYMPDAAATALRSRKSRQVAIVITARPGEPPTALSEAILASAARVLADAGYRLLVQVVERQTEAPDVLDTLCAGRAADGGIVRSFTDEPQIWARLRHPRAPVVIVGQCSDPLLTSVAHDVRGMAARAVDHLVGRGHRRIGFLGQPLTGDFHRLMLDAWVARSSHHGLDPRKWCAVATDREDGRRIAAEWLEGTGDHAPTALVATSGRAAVGIGDVLAAAEPGERTELLVIGGAEYAWILRPGTWVVGPDQQAVGRAAAEQLLAQLAGGEPAGAIRLLPEIECISRGAA